MGAHFQRKIETRFGNTDYSIYEFKGIWAGLHPSDIVQENMTIFTMRGNNPKSIAANTQVSGSQSVKDEINSVCFKDLWKSIILHD